MFAIIEGGRRVGVPIDRLLRAELSVTPVAALAATAGTPLAGHSDEDKAAANREPAGAAPAATKQLRQLAAYHAGDEPAPRRRLQFAADLMQSPVHTLPLDAEVGAAWRLLLTERFHHVPVIDAAGVLIGIVSDRDLWRAQARAQSTIDNWPLARLMQPHVIVATAETPVRALAEVMAARRIGALPVVDAASRPTGIVSRSDILRALVGEAPLELWG